MSVVHNGDSGMTQLYNGEQIDKDVDYFDCLGDLDELNSHLGLACEYVDKPELRDFIRSTQSHLLDLGSHVATPLTKSHDRKVTQVEFDPKGELTSELDQKSSEWLGQLPPLKNFILPGGGLASATLHVARSVTRRAERHLTSLYRRDDVSQRALVYLNRLSYALFLLARLVATEEITYQKTKGPTSNKKQPTSEQGYPYMIIGILPLLIIAIICGALMVNPPEGRTTKRIMTEGIVMISIASSYLIISGWNDHRSHARSRHPKPDPIQGAISQRLDTTVPCMRGSDSNTPPPSETDSES